MNSKRKGKRGELELARELKRHGYDVHRSVQYNGRIQEGDPDLTGLPGIHIECKRVERLNIQDAMEQAVRDHKDDEMPAVFHRKNRGQWMVTMQLEDWIQLYSKTQKSPD